MTVKEIAELNILSGHEIVVIRSNGGDIVTASDQEDFVAYEDCEISGLFPSGDDLFVFVTDEELNF